MNILVELLNKLRKKSIECAIARCDAYTVYSSPYLFPPFFRLINTEETVYEMDKYARQKIKEAVEKQIAIEREEMRLKEEQEERERLEQEERERLEQEECEKAELESMKET